MTELSKMTEMRVFSKVFLEPEKKNKFLFLSIEYFIHFLAHFKHFSH